MLQRLLALPLAASLFVICPNGSAAVRPHHHSSSHPIVRRSASTHTAHTGHVTERSSVSGISTDRATEIQSALIQHGYLTGEPTGNWDSASVAAMQRLQSDNGWQTKFVPDSRALIKLGLGSGGISTASSGSGTPNAPIAIQAGNQTF